MKKLFIFLSTIFIAVMAMTAWAQEKPKLSYQAVVRDNQNKLLNYSSVNVEINILKPNLVVQYSETFNGVATNQNGLMSLLIGNKSAWDDVDWFNAKINVKITLPDDMGVVESTFDVSAVPLAISAMYSDSVNLESIPQSDWNETNSAKCMFIKNKPNIIDTIVSNLSNPNSTANHIVDSIADNHIQWSMDTLISNRKLADSLNVARGALVDTAKNLRDAINDININLCTTVMDCAGIQTMRDSIQTNNVAIAANTTAISTETTNRINAKNEIKGIIKADSILFAGRVNNLSDSVKMNVQAIIDSSEHIRNEISAATAVLPSLETRFKADSTNLTDNYYTKTKINDTLSKYSTTSAMDARHYLTSDSLIITDMQDKLIKHNIRISANYKGIIDTANKIRTDINTILSAYQIRTCEDVMACEGITLMGTAIAVNTSKIASDSAILAEKIYNDSLQVMKQVSDTAKAVRKLIKTASGDVGELVLRVEKFNTHVCDSVKDCVMGWIADSLNTNIRPVLSNKANKATTLFGYGITDATISGQTITLGSNTITVATADGLSGLRESVKTNNTNIKNLSDSVKMNVQAIIDSSEHIRNEISAATAVLPSLETRFKVDSTNLADNYYTKTKINDTLSKYSTTSAMDARHYLTSDSLIITDMQDTLIQHNTRISANYKGIIDTAAAIRASINAITVNDAALTIQKNGADVATFSANANTDVTANVNVYDGKLYIKFNGDTLGHFTADQEDTVVVDIKLKQLSTCLRLTEATKDTLDYVEGFLDVTGLLLSVPDKYNCVDSTNCLIQLYINGVYIGSTATRDDVMKFINGKLYYFPAYNDNKVLKVNDRIEVIYWVK